MVWRDWNVDCVLYTSTHTSHYLLVQRTFALPTDAVQRVQLSRGRKNSWPAQHQMVRVGTYQVKFHTTKNNFSYRDGGRALVLSAWFVRASTRVHVYVRVHVCACWVARIVIFSSALLTVDTRTCPHADPVGSVASVANRQCVVFSPQPP